MMAKSRSLSQETWMCNMSQMTGILMSQRSHLRTLSHRPAPSRHRGNALATWTITEKMNLDLKGKVTRNQIQLSTS